MRTLVVAAILTLLVVASARADTSPTCAQLPNLACAAGDTYTGTHNFTGATVTVDDNTVQNSSYNAKCARFDASGFLVAAAADCGSGTGDVADVGPGCAGGACLTNGVVTTGTSMFIWEGTTDNAYEYTVAVPAADPGASLTWTFPSTTGNLVSTGDTGTVTGTMIFNGTVDTADLAASSVTSAEIEDGTIGFAEIKYTEAIGDSPTLASGTAYFGAGGIIYEGTTEDVYEGLLTVADITTADKTWTLPNVTGTIITTGDTGSVTAGMISNSFITWNEKACLTADCLGADDPCDCCTGVGAGCAATTYTLAATPRADCDAFGAGGTIMAWCNGIQQKCVAATPGINEFALATNVITPNSGSSVMYITYEQ